MADYCMMIKDTVRRRHRNFEVSLSVKWYRYTNALVFLIYIGQFVISHIKRYFVSQILVQVHQVC